MRILLFRIDYFSLIISKWEKMLLKWVLSISLNSETSLTYRVVEMKISPNSYDKIFRSCSRAKICRDSTTSI